MQRDFANRKENVKLPIEKWAKSMNRKLIEENWQT